MLGTGARYAEYGITGGFFIFTRALILGLAYPDVLVSGAQSFGVLLAASAEKIPEQARPAILSLLVAAVRAENLNPGVLVMQPAKQGVRHDASDLLSRA